VLAHTPRRRVRLKARVVVAHPTDVVGVVVRVGPHARDDLGDIRVAEGERSLILRDVLDGTVDRIDVDGGLHRRGFPAFQIAPPLPFIPEERHGEPFIVFVACFNGPDEEGERLLSAFRDVAEPVAEHVDRMPYPALTSAFDALVPPGLQHYWKASFLPKLSDEAIAAHLSHGPKVPTVVDGQPRRSCPEGRDHVGAFDGTGEDSQAVAVGRSSPLTKQVGKRAGQGPGSARRPAPPRRL